MKRILIAIACTLVMPLFASTVKVGFASKDVTPDSGALSHGVLTHGWGTGKVAYKVENKLFVKAVAIKDSNGKLLVILTADTVKFHPIDYIDLRNWFEKEFKTGKWHLAVNVSHTHQAPYWYLPKPWKDPQIRAYIAEYRKIIMSASKTVIEQAVKNATTLMTIKYANLQISKEMIYNKIITNSRGKLAAFNYIEKDLGVMAFFNAETNKLSGILWSISAHPTNAFLPLKNGKPEVQIGNNIVGYTDDAIKEYFGGNVNVLFAQGAAGEMKVKYPEINQKWNRKKRCTDNFDKKTGKLLDYSEFRHVMYLYGVKIAKLIKDGLDTGKFTEIDNINIQVAGKTSYLVAGAKYSTEKITKRQIAKREEAKKQLAQKNISDLDRYRCRETLYIYNEKGQRIAPVSFQKISFNAHFQIITMSGEVCSKIGKEVKDYYRAKGIKTMFWGYSDAGCGYYPDNQIARYRYKNGRRLYWGNNVSFCEDDFDFDKFALDNIVKLQPE